jgi:hypothetical protein
MKLSEFYRNIKKKTSLIIVAIVRSCKPYECALAPGRAATIKIKEPRRTMEYKNSFICYESVYRQFERMIRRGKQ